MNNHEMILDRALELLKTGHSFSIVTVLEIKGNTPAMIGEKMIVPDEGLPIGTIGGGSLERNAAEYCRTGLKKAVEIQEYDLAGIGMTCGGHIKLLFERLTAKPGFVLFGGGHVATALAPLLETIGYDVAVFDNREGIIEEHTTSGRKAFLIDYEHIGPAKAYLAAGHSFIATHNHRFDTTVLKQLLSFEEIDFKYIGMIGSKNKVRGALDEIRSAGLEIPPQLFAPVGLPLGGGSPSEIAVSIAAEVLSVRYGQSVPHMRG